jgi:hypothetical protein
MASSVGWENVQPAETFPRMSIERSGSEADFENEDENEDEDDKRGRNNPAPHGYSNGLAKEGLSDRFGPWLKSWIL